MIPYTNWERLALLEEIEQGHKIVLPVNMNHALAMRKVAQFYIDQQHKEVMDALSKDHTSELTND